MGHIVLLGDSIFDNARYVPEGPAVIDHLRGSLPGGWNATLRAVDGSVTDDVAGQLEQLPPDASHLFVSAGGNDALGHAAVFAQSVATFAEALDQLEGLHAGFEAAYRTMLARLAARRLPAAVCTVYDAIPGLAPSERAGLCVFNDVILREAARVGLPVIDLRLVCTEASDYSSLSPIEPSRLGGRKIALAIGRVVAQHDFEAGGCRIYV